MPLYEYECTQCHRTTEKRQKFSDPEITECPFCQGKLERVLSAPAVHFAGGGWYADLYSSKSGAKKDASANASGESGTSSESEGGKSSDSSDSSKSSDSKSSDSKPGDSGKSGESSKSSKGSSSTESASSSSTPAASAPASSGNTKE